MGRWKIGDLGQRQMMATVALTHDGADWRLERQGGTQPFASPDPDTSRIWWKDVGVHQNLTFPVHPDPVSGQHCWHQAVRVRRADAGDEHGDVFVDAAKSHAVYEKWLAMARPAERVSPDGKRRPYWLLRPLRPDPAAYEMTAIGRGD
jgi:hypothetical protein